TRIGTRRRHQNQEYQKKTATPHHTADQTRTPDFCQSPHYEDRQPLVLSAPFVVMPLEPAHEVLPSAFEGDVRTDGFSHMLVQKPRGFLDDVSSELLISHAA